MKHTQLLAQTRKKLGLRKSEENDARILKSIYEERPEAFKRHTAVERLISKYVVAAKIVKSAESCGLEC